MSESTVSKKRGRPRAQSHSPERKRKVSGRGKPLNSQSRSFVCQLREYFEKERDNGAPLLPVNKVVERTAAALNISKNSVVTIGKEKSSKEEQGEEDAILETPGKKRKFKKRVTELDSFQKDAIRRHIYDYYRRKEYPTIRKLHVTLKNVELFHGSKSSLCKVLREVGFKYKKINGRKLLMERKDIVAWRGDFLRDMLHVNLDDCVWLDETWVNANHTVQKTWTDDSEKSILPVPLGKGGRLILLHAGTSKGFVPNCLLLFRSKKTGDYHEEMNHNTFKKWFEENLLKNLTSPSCIVMDNARYHSVIFDKPPTSNSLKAEMVDWLKRHGVQHGNLNREQLMKLVRKHKPEYPLYVIDEIARKHGHKVIRLPPYHCHFNPIEHIWAQVKGYVARNNKLFTVSEVEKLTKEAIETINAENWKRVVEHTKTVLSDARKNEGILDERVEQLIVSLGNSSDSSSEDTEDSDSDISGVFPLSP